MSWFTDLCLGLSDDVGAVTGAVYGAGAYGISGGNVPFSAAVGQTISNTVDSGFQNGVCPVGAAIFEAPQPSSAPLDTPSSPDLG